MPLLSLHDVTLAFGGPPVLDRASLAIERGDRVCLIGRNGAGKSSLLQLLDGTHAPDDGRIVRHGSISVARLGQALPASLAGTVFDVAAGGLGDAGTLLARWHRASHEVAQSNDASALRALDRLHQELDAANAWQAHTRVDTVLSRLALDPDAPFDTLSGGRRRQALLARALASDPDVLLLDEPTNHLDINAIEWLEDFLVDGGPTLVFVTHDRAFLRRVATRIVELDRGRLADWGVDYDTYLERKDAALHAEAQEAADFDRRLAQEEVWIRTGIQARRTRNEGRVRALEAMRRERAARREREGTARLAFDEAARSGQLVADVRSLGFAHGETRIVRDLDLRVLRGDRIGLVGPNGVGKTTLLRLLLGQLAPQQGTVRLGTNLEIAWFDQLREQLDPDATVFDSIADGADFIQLGGRERHVNGWLQEFLFPPERARTPVRALSGGERSRLLLARLFTRPFNLLVLDEPTNDLDLETLDLLEDRLLEFSGTLLLVSHDRAFLDAVVTSVLVFEGDGVVTEHAGGYAEWARRRAAAVAAAAATAATAMPAARGRAASPRTTAAPAASARPRKLTLAEAKELAALPDRIDRLEREHVAQQLRLADPETLRDPAALRVVQEAVAALETELTAAMARWEQLAEVEAAR